MSYNGIGLPTARGTGTNGYIQKNLSHVRPRDDYRSRKSDDWRSEKSKQREPDAGILEHERKRKVEVGCMELRIKLEDEGFGEVEIEEQVQDLRQELLTQFERQPATYGGPTRQETKALRPSDVHALGAAKRAETESMQRALGIREGYREGDAFDRDLQEKLRQERIEERKRRDLEREEARREREAAWRRRKAQQEEERTRWESERARNSRVRGKEREGGESRGAKEGNDRSPGSLKSLSRSPTPRRQSRSARGEPLPRSSSKRGRYSSEDTSEAEGSRRRRSASYSRSPSPPPRRSRRRSPIDSASRSASPRRSRPRSASESVSISLSPPPHRNGSSIERKANSQSPPPPSRPAPVPRDVVNSPRYASFKSTEQERTQESRGSPPGPPPRRPDLA